MANAITLTPSDGLRNVASYPTNPTTEAAARDQIQSVIDQVVSQANSSLDTITKYPCARVYHNANISIANNTTTVLPFNSENFDTDNIHDTATNNTRLTCKTSGKYQITANVAWALGTGGRRGVNIKLNGIAFNYIASQESSPQPDNVGYAVQNVTTLYNLNVGDYVEVEVYQSSGASLNIQASNYTPLFMMAKVG